MKLFNVELKMTVPNALSIFRLLLLPVFVILFFSGDEGHPHLLYWAFGVLVLSGLTDSLDGIIARRCNQISDLGKLLDPLADKITQVVVVVCLAIRFGGALIPLVVICFLKELGQAVGGLFLLKKGEQVHGAKWYGKVSTFVFYGVMAVIVLLPDMPGWVRALLVGVVILLMLFAFFNYLCMFIGIKKTMPAAASKGSEIDESSSLSDKT